MKANFKYLAMMLTAGLFMASCSNDEVENLIPETKGEPVQFQMGVTNADTRTTTGSNYVTTFVTGDAVGIFAYERAADGSNGTLAVTNAKYVLGADNNWAVEGSNGIYAENGKTFNYYAYYPYQTGVTDPASIGITVKADQSVVADYNISDALTAKNTSVVAGTTTVPLAFHHAFSLVQVNLKGSLADKDAVVTMQNVFPTAKLNTQTEITASAEGTLGTIKMYPMPTNQDAGATQFAYRAIVPAQTVATGQSLLEITSGGKTYKFTYSTDVKYDAAKVRVMNVTLGESGQNTITIPASDTTIDNWGNSEAGTGTGTVEEVLPPAKDLVTIPISNATIGEITPATGDNVINTDNANWFAVLRTGTTSFSIVDDADYTKAIKVSYVKEQSWYSNFIGFYNPNTENIVEGKEYKLSFYAKTTAPISDTPQIWTYIKLKGENKFCGISGVTATSILEGTNKTMKAFNVTADWALYETTFTFAVVGDKSGIGSSSTCTVATEWANITKKDYYIGLASMKAAGDFYFANVKLEEVK